METMKEKQARETNGGKWKQVHCDFDTKEHKQ